MLGAPSCSWFSWWFQLIWKWNIAETTTWMLQHITRPAHLLKHPFTGQGSKYETPPVAPWGHTKNTPHCMRLSYEPQKNHHLWNTKKKKNWFCLHHHDKNLSKGIQLQPFRPNSSNSVFFLLDIFWLGGRTSSISTGTLPAQWNSTTWIVVKGGVREWKMR